MIVPMKKVSLIVLNSEKKQALRVLQKAGIMHLESLQGSSDALSALKADYAKTETASLALSEVKLPKGKKIAQILLEKNEALEKVAEITQFLEQKKVAEERILKNERELERFKKWGTVNPCDFANLAEKGIYLSLYEIPASSYYDMTSDVQTILVNEDKNMRRFVAIGKDAKIASNLSSDVVAVPLPEKSTEVLCKENEDAKKEIALCDENLMALTAYATSLKNLLKKLSKEIEFENVFAGMEREADDEKNALAWLTGFVPANECETLKKIAKDEAWAFTADDPSEDDAVPTKLKNSKPVQMLYPVLDFLGTVPGYREFDISAWFLVFLTIFFAMIFGDAGYGSLLLIIGLVMIAKTKLAKKQVAPAITLLTVWALATVVWGTLNCSWFGIEYTLLPAFLQKLALPAFAPNNVERDMNLQIFCFLLALAQMSIGHVIAAIRNVKEKSLKVLADIGSLSILWGMFYVVLMLIVSQEKFPMHNAILVMIGLGFALSFVFSNYEGSIGKSILESVKNIISVLLGVINFFSDTVSYIRLWAVALAGSAIAETVNTMAGPMLGNFLIFFAIILLVFGHGLNMILNVLSVIVHGVRLNTLEFTSHVGMSWTGFKYEPFKE